MRNLILIVAAGLLLMFTCSRVDRSEVPDIDELFCELDGESLVTVGAATYVIPTTLRGANISEQDGFRYSAGNYSRYERTFFKICPLNEVNEFSVDQLDVYSPAEYLRTPTHFPVAASVSINAPHASSEDMYRTRNWERAEIRNEVAGFQAIAGIGVGLGGRPFIQANPSVFTPQGSPVMFGCYERTKLYRGHECFSWWIDEYGNTISIKFDDESFPPDKWLELFESVNFHLAELKLRD